MSRGMTISDRLANAVYISDLLEGRYPELVAGLRRILRDHEIPLRIIRGTRDIWCRDFMPAQVDSGKFVQFRYSPDYLRGHEHLITRPTDINPIPEILDCQESRVVLDGGNVVRWGDRCILTDKVFEENPGIGRASLLDLLRRIFRVVEVIVIPTEPGDVVGHADGVVRFLDAGLVVVNDYSELDPEYGDRLVPILQQAGLECVELPYRPEEPSRSGIPSAVGCYANFLMVRGLIVLPTFGIPEDDAATQVIHERARHQAVATIDCSDLAAEGGVLNCVTWTIAAGQQNHQ
jgi:agmatine deiminase